MRYFGDPVDGLRYKVADYGKRESKKICINCKKEIPNDDTTDSTNDTKTKKGSKKSNPNTPTTPKDDGTIGFDLMSLSSRRGHFIDHVIIRS